MQLSSQQTATSIRSIVHQSHWFTSFRTIALAKTSAFSCRLKLGAKFRPPLHISTPEKVCFKLFSKNSFDFSHVFNLRAWYNNNLTTISICIELHFGKPMSNFVNQIDHVISLNIRVGEHVKRWITALFQVGINQSFSRAISI